MTAGRPNYQRLHELGKLPPDQRMFIPGLKEADEKDKEIAELKAEIERLKGGKKPVTKEEVKVVEEVTKAIQESAICEEEGCDFVGKNANGLRLHSAKHKK